MSRINEGGKALFYQKVLDYCKSQNISISAFEKKCGIGNGTIGRWADGSKPSIETLIKIANATGIAVEEWVKESC